MTQQKIAYTEREASTQTPDELLTQELAAYYADPLGFVMMAYPWGQPGTELEHEKGPDENQKRFLIDLGKAVAARAFNGTDPVMPILMTETSGHGTGKASWAPGSRTGFSAPVPTRSAR